MIRTIIFDLDGTLLYTLEDLKEAANFALDKFGYPTRSIEEVRGFVGNGVRKLIERSVPKNCTNIDECLEIFKKNYSEIMYNHTLPYNGILEILKELKQSGLKIAVVSNKFDDAVKELCKRYFGDLVDAAIGQSDNILRKPAPDSVFKAMKELGADNQTTAYVGDSEVDVQTAKNSGLRCIAVTWGFRDRKDLYGADFIIDNPYDIIDLVRSM